MKTRKHRGGNSNRNIFAWQRNPNAVQVPPPTLPRNSRRNMFAWQAKTNAVQVALPKTYKMSAENEAFYGSQSQFGPGQSVRALSNITTYVPRPPRKVTYGYNGVNYVNTPKEKKPSWFSSFFGAKQTRNQKNKKRFPGVGVATRRLSVNRNNASSVSINSE
jgi:hypothetical protein